MVLYRGRRAKQSAASDGWIRLPDGTADEKRPFEEEPMTPRSTSGHWIAYHRPRANPRLRLFCFPYAGVAASIYRTWQDELPEEIEVCPVQLPGREGRMREEPFRQMGPLVDALVEAMGPLLDRPFALFGYSMGSIVAFETGLRLEALGKSPVRTLVAARRAPGFGFEEPTHTLSSEDFRKKLMELEGTPKEVLEHPELMELVEPLLRADFELNDLYAPLTEGKLECPMSIYGAVADKEVEREALEGWREMTRGESTLRIFPGGHFFLHDDRSTLLGAIAGDLATHR